MNPSSTPPKTTKNPASEQSVTFDALNTGVIQSPKSLDADVDSTKAIIEAEERQAHSQLVASQAAKSRRRLIKFAALTLVLLVGLGLVALRHHSATKTTDDSQMDASQRYGNTSIPLASLNGSTGLSVQNTESLSVNGQLNVNNSLVIAPAARPKNAVTGQLYFDQTSNELSYFNGTEFVPLTKSTPAPNIPLSVSSLGSATGAVALGSGLNMNGQTLSNTGVLTLQGEAGNVSLVAGSGIAVSGTTLSNTGLLSLGNHNGDISLGSGLGFSGNQLRNTGIISAIGSGTITVTNDGNGNIVIDSPNSGGAGSGTVASPGGTSGKIAKFTGVQTIADSLLSDDGTTVTIGGALHVTGTVTLNTALSVTNGGTGASTAAGARSSLGAAASGANTDITSLSGLTTALTVAQGGTGVGTLPTNSVLIGNGTSGLTSTVAGAAGLCLISTAGAPAFATCPGSGGVASVDGLTGALTIANTTTAGSTITLNDASTSSKGIASFNATNFLVSAGSVNTAQDIAVTSTPTFASLSLTNPLAVSSGGTGRNSLTSNGVLVGNGTSAVNTATGSNGQCLVITGTTPGFTTCPGSGGVTTVNSANGAITIQGTAGSSVSTVGGVITINDATSTTKGLAAFNSTNFSVTSGTVDTAQDIATTSAPSFAQLSVVSNQASGKMLTINNTNAAATGNLLDLQVSGSSKLTVASNGSLTTNGNLSVGGTVSSGAINGQTIGSSSSFTGSVNVAGNLAVNTIANTGALTVGVGAQSFTLQGNNTSTITATNGTSTTTVAFQSPTANVTYNFGTAAAGTYDICTTAGNCVGAGGGVTSSGGTSGKLAIFTGSNTIGDSSISDNGSTVTIAGALSVNTITPTGSLTVGATGQNLTLQGAAVTLSATSSGITNSLVFATPAASNKTITLPNASGTVAVSASGPLVLDSFGNLSCPTCLSGGSGGGSGVSSLNGLSGALTLQGSDAATFSSAGTTITVSDASATVKGVAKFNSTNLTVTSGSVNTVQDIAVTAAPTFAGLSLSSALTVTNGGTGANSASGARTNLGAAASGINSDITQITGLTTALSVAQGGTGVATTPTNGQILIGNGSGFSLNTLTAGSGVNITNSAGTVTISAPGSGTCATCANTALSNLASVAINTSLLPGTAGAADLGSASLPFGQLFLSGTSASPASNNFKITGAATAARTITLPDASGTVAVSATGYLSLSASGNLTFVGPLAVADGGTGANSASGARTNLGAAASGANSDITSLSGLSTALSVGQGGTGLSSLTANQLLYASSSSTIAQLGNGASGLCLISNGPSAAPSFQTCTGAGGVSSIDSLSGALSINNTTGTGSTITINDAAADGTTKGIAAFNGTNFTAISGVVNTVQGIATTSTPTFAGLTLSGTLTANTITPNGAMVIGASTQSLTLQGSGASTITATGGGFTTTIGFSGTPTANVTYDFDRSAAAGTYSICTTAGNCTGASGGYVGGNGTARTLAIFTGSGYTIGNSILSQDAGATTVTVTGALTATGTVTANAFSGDGSALTSLNGSNISSGTVSDTYVADNLTINSSGSVDWTALTNYPAGCSAGSAVTALGDTVTCTAFAAGSGSGNYIQNQNSSAQTTANFWISGTGTATALQASTFDTASAGALSIGSTNATSISLAQNTTLAAGKSLTITGGITSSRPGSPSAGTLYYDTSTNQLLQYNGTKWVGSQKTAILVAAAGSTQTDKDAADYIATGTNDQTTIASAISALPSTGGTVYLLPGTYNFGAPLAITKANVTLTSSNPESTKLNRAFDGSSLTNGALIYVNASTVTLSNFRLEGNKDTYYNSTDNGIYKSASVGHLHIDSLDIYNTEGDGIYLDGGSSLLSVQNVITNSVVDTAYYGIYTNYATSTTITGNTVQNTGIGIYGPASNLTITGNSVMSNNKGIDIAGNESSAVNNRVSGNSTAGITVEASNVTVTGNVADENYYGIYLDGTSDSNVVISSNDVSNNSDTGIILTSLGSPCSNIAISDNTFSNNVGSAINANSNCNSVNVTGNVLQNNGTSGGYSSIVARATGMNLTGNTIVVSAGAGYGIQIGNGTTGTYLSNNTYSGSGLGAIYDVGTGTIYDGQMTSSTGNFLFRVNTDSASAFAIQNASGTSAINVDTSANQITLNDATTINNTALVSTTSASAFKIQDASAVTLFNADTSTSTITLGSLASGNYITFTAAGGLTAYGTAQHTKNIALTAEYAGGVLYGGDTGGANCSINSNGTMTSGYDTSSNQMSYYVWTSPQTTSQCYDVIVRVAIPSDFSSWSGTPSIKLKTDSTANSSYAISIIKSDGSTYDSSYGSAYTSPGTLGTSWANMATSSLDSSGYTAGGYMTIRIRMTAKNSANLQLGDIVLTYNSKF